MEYRRIEETVKNLISSRNGQRTLYSQSTEEQSSAQLLTEDESADNGTQAEINKDFEKEASNRVKKFCDGFKSISMPNDEMENRTQNDSNAVSYQSTDEYETDESNTGMEMETDNDQDSSSRNMDDTNNKARNGTKHKTHQMSLSSVLINNSDPLTSMSNQGSSATSNRADTSTIDRMSTSCSYLSEQVPNEKDRSEQASIQQQSDDKETAKLTKKCFVLLKAVDLNLIKNLNKSKRATQIEQIEPVPKVPVRSNKGKRIVDLDTNDLDSNQIEKRKLQFFFILENTYEIATLYKSD